MKTIEIGNKLHNMKHGRKKEMQKRINYKQNKMYGVLILRNNRKTSKWTYRD
jgi:hypothetical protein